MLKISNQAKDVVALLITAVIISGVLIWGISQYDGVIDKWLWKNAHLLVLIPIFVPFIIWICIEHWIMEEDGNGKQRIKGLRVMP